MKIILSCGSPFSGWDAASEILTRCGLLATDTERLSGWHHQLLQSHGEVSPGLSLHRVLSPDQMLEKWARDWLTDQKEIHALDSMWGWASELDCWLLDFWAGLEPDLGFVLFYSSPEVAIEGMVRHAPTEVDPKSILAAWRSYNQEILRFCRRNRRRVLLLNASECQQNPAQFLAECENRFGLELQTYTEPAQLLRESDPVVSCLARAWLNQDGHACQALHLELQASAVPLVEGSSQTQRETVSVHGTSDTTLAIARYQRTLSESRGLAERLQGAERHQASLGAQLAQTIAAQLEDKQRFEAEIAKLEVSLGQAEVELKASNTHLEGLYQQRQEGETKLREAEQQQAGLRQQLEQVQAEHARAAESARQQLHEAQERLAAVQSDGDRYRETVQKEIVALQAAHTAERNSLEVKLAADLAAQAQAKAEAEIEINKQSLAIEELEQARQETAEENELHLLQLHQVQEELEALFQQRQEDETKLREADQQSAGLRQKLEQANAEHARAEESARRQLQEAQERLAAVQSDGDRYREAMQEEIAALQAAHSAERNSLQEKLTADLAAQAQAKAEAETEVNKQRLAIEELEQARQETGDENELLLLQLHQVQDELEHYFLKYQEIELATQLENQERQAMQARHPEFCTVEALKVLGGNQTAPFRNLNCELVGLKHGDRHWAKVNIKLLDHNGQPGLEFREETDTFAMPLSHWVQSGQDAAGRYMLILPTSADHAATLQGMSTSDWLLLNGLADLLNHHLKTGEVDRGEKARATSLAPWRETARALQQQLRQILHCFRYDALTVGEAYIGNRYEHLRLDFTNAQFGDRLLPHLSFKFAAKEVEGEQFTKVATLAFREQDSGIAPFAAWPPQNADEFGPVLQLDFVEDPTSTQQGEWQALTQEDRACVSSILQKLPSMLAKLENQGRQLERPWAQWQGLARQMRVPPLNESAQVSQGRAEAPMQPVAPLGYESVQLGENFVQHNYEHLRLDFSGLRHRDRLVGTYTVKLGATDVKDGCFSNQALLVFRDLDDGRPPLEAWPKATADAFGPVIKLAFAEKIRPEEEADWQKLTATDLDFVEGLLAVLPAALKELKQQDKQIQREWEDWVDLLAGMRMPEFSLDPAKAEGASA